MSAARQMLEPIRPPGDADSHAFERALAAEARRRLELYDRAEADPHLAALLNERGKHDPAWWVNTFVWGLDPRRSRLRTHPVVLFDQQLPELEAVLGPHPIALDASRDTGKTVTMLAGGIYETTTIPGTMWGLTSKTGGEVDHGGEWQSLFGMLRFMLRHIPSWARPDWHGVRSPRPMIELGNGSAFVGAMATPTAFHGPRFRRIVVDEAARVRRLRDVMTGVLGATDAPMLISTPRGRGGHFASVIHGEVSPIVRWSPGVEVEPGSWLHLRMHYSDDPRRDEEWAAKKRSEVGDDVIWAQQYEIDYTASVPGRIWPEFVAAVHVLSEDEWRHDRATLEHARIIEAWDPGLHTAVVWLAHWESTGVVDVLDYRMWVDCSLDQIVADARRVPWHAKASLRVGDPAIAARSARDLKSWRDDMRDRGLSIRSRAIVGRTRDLREQVRRGLRDERLYFSPRCSERHHRDWPSMVECVESYRRDLGSVDDLAHMVVRGNGEPDPLKDIHSHLADALQYGVDWCWPMQQAGARVRRDGRWRDPEPGAGLGTRIKVSTDW